MNGGQEMKLVKIENYWINPDAIEVRPVDLQF